MTPSNEDKLMEEIGEMKRELHDLKVSLIGDKLSKPIVMGVLDILKTHHVEMYGDEDTQHEGLKKRVVAALNRIENLEDDRKKIYWMCGGISTGVWAVLYVVQWIYGK